MLIMNATPPDPNDRKNRTGQWEKGTSGNPAGRPRGSRNRASIMMEQLLDGQAEKLVQKVVTSALEGNTHAMAICLDRLIPRCKERTINFDTPPINNYNDILRAAETIFDGIGKGQITPTEGEKLTRVLQFQLQSYMALDFESRIAAIERELFPSKEEVEFEKEKRAELLTEFKLEAQDKLTLTEEKVIQDEGGTHGPS